MSAAPSIRPARSNVLVSVGKPQPITDVIRGKTVERVLKTAEQMLLRFTDGTEVRVGWFDETGRVPGVPMIDDVRRWK